MLIDGAGVLLPVANYGYRVFDVVVLARFDRLLPARSSRSVGVKLEVENSLRKREPWSAPTPANGGSAANLLFTFLSEKTAAISVRLHRKHD